MQKIIVIKREDLSEWAYNNTKVKDNGVPPELRTQELVISVLKALAE